MPLKISVITASYNSEKTIADTMRSISQQSYTNIESVLVDGCSTDNTLEICLSAAPKNLVVDSRMDSGIYDALNRGVGLASGDVIGFLHSDDFFPSKSALDLVARVFEDPSIDICYGDLAYVSKSNVGKVVRRWRAGKFRRCKLGFGWMPPHPTLYIRREILRKHPFNPDYRISADYDVILRILNNGDHRVAYIPREIVHMRVGGTSNKSVKNIVAKTLEDWRVIKSNRIGGILTLILKNLRKVPQFLFVQKVKVKEEK